MAMNTAQALAVQGQHKTFWVGVISVRRALSVYRTFFSSFLWDFLDKTLDKDKSKQKWWIQEWSIYLWSIRVILLSSIDRKPLFHYKHREQYTLIFYFFKWTDALIISVSAEKFVLLCIIWFNQSLCSSCAFLSTYIQISLFGKQVRPSFKKSVYSEKE